MYNLLNKIKYNKKLIFGVVIIGTCSFTLGYYLIKKKIIKLRICKDNEEDNKEKINVFNN